MITKGSPDSAPINLSPVQFGYAAFRTCMHLDLQISYVVPTSELAERLLYILTTPNQLSDIRRPHGPDGVESQFDTAAYHFGQNS